VDEIWPSGYRASDCQCQNRQIVLWLSPNILRHSGIIGAAEKNEAVLNESTTKILAKKLLKNLETNLP
jgi:hypothetical protein